MCSECDWPSVGYQIPKKCDCGNSKWQQTPLQTEATGLSMVTHSLFRCTKCDALISGEHLFKAIENSMQSKP